MKSDLVLRVVAKVFLPFILIFALYVQFHGDFGPGGGFQAGVIIAAAIIFYALIYGLANARRLVPEGLVETMMAAGVPLGAYRPFQASAENPANPLSAMVGTSGAAGERVRLVTASGRILPAWMCGTEEGSPSIINCTLPGSSAVMAGPLPA